MSTASTPQPERWWAAEPADAPNRARIRARVAGLHCSLCTGTIEKGLGRLPGVERVAVSLTHEQTLVDYDPGRIDPDRILSTLRTSATSSLTRGSSVRSRKRRPSWSARACGSWPRSPPPWP